MIIARNGTEYNQITNEIIKAHATSVNSPFVKVDRALNYKKTSDDEFFDELENLSSNQKEVQAYLARVYARRSGKTENYYISANGTVNNGTILTQFIRACGWTGVRVENEPAWLHHVPAESRKSLQQNRVESTQLEIVEGYPVTVRPLPCAARFRAFALSRKPA